MTTMAVSADDLDELDVKAEVMVIFHQNSVLKKRSLVLMMTMTFDDPNELDVKAEVMAIFHQKRLHSDLKYFDVQIHL